MATTQVPVSAFRFTRQMYHRMGDAGLFDGMRVELLDGEVLKLSPQDSLHAGTVHRVFRAATRALQGSYAVRVQAPVVLGDLSEPEPDVAICEPDPQDYLGAHPKADQVLVVLEVAHSSLSYDRVRKAEAYARSGIPTYVIANLLDRRLEVRSDPDRASGEYRRAQILSETDQLDWPGGAQTAVSDLLPPR